MRSGKGGVCAGAGVPCFVSKQRKDKRLFVITIQANMFMGVEGDIPQERPQMSDEDGVARPPSTEDYLPQWGRGKALIGVSDAGGGELR